MHLLIERYTVSAEQHRNLYAVILKDFYGIELGSMHLLQLHPDLESYQFIQVTKLEEISRSLLSRCGADRAGGVCYDLLASRKGPLGNDTSGYSDVCLIDALRRLGVPVEASRSGPLWALMDGNSILRPFGLQLTYADARPLQHGRYVMWTPASSTGHFEPVLCCDTLMLIDEEGEPEDRADEDVILRFMYCCISVN